MDRLEAMSLFVTVADEASLAEAARHHGRSPATVTRAVALLEGLAGEPLLLRSTRQVKLTPAGARHLAIWRDVLALLKEAEPASRLAPLQGGIVVTAPELFGRITVMPMLDAFLRQYPSIAARVLLVNRMVDLIGEGVDVAVRLGSLADTNLTAVGLGEMRTLVCASPEYLASAGTPGDPGDLRDHACIGLNAEGHGELWPFAAAQGRRLRVRSVHIRARLSVNNAGAAIDAALRGHGLVRARAYQVAEHIAAGRLTVVLRDYELPPDPVHLVFHADNGRRRPVRAFIDHAVPAIRGELRRTAAVFA